MIRSLIIVLFMLPALTGAQATHVPLTSLRGLKLHNAVAEPATLAGRKGLRVTPVPGTADGDCLVVIDGVDDAFYLRPTNGRVDDQERRNHATQYVSLPQWTWSRLRTETPSRYESYVDLEPGVWTKIRIEVKGDRARLFVHDQKQPTPVVNDVKSGVDGKGSVALWIGPGSVAHFRNLNVRLSSLR